MKTNKQMKSQTDHFAWTYHGRYEMDESTLLDISSINSKPNYPKPCHYLEYFVVTTFLLHLKKKFIAEFLDYFVFIATLF